MGEITVKSKKRVIDQPAFPCGACRQVISETIDRQNSPIQVVLFGEAGPFWIFDDGKDHLLLDKEQSLNVPMVLIQGMADPDVPWETTARIEQAFPKSDIDIVLVEDGDHRLSRPEDLELIDKEVLNLSYRNEEYSTF